MYDFDNAKERHGTHCIKWDAIGKDLFPMWIADMDFPAPPPVLKALRERIDHGVFGYGIRTGLEGTICAWMKEEFGVTVEEDWIIFFTEIVAILKAASHLREGPVITHTPNYNALLEAPPIAGKDIILSPLRNTNEYYEMDFDDMQRRLPNPAGPLYLCSPHNPVGRVFKKEELLELSRFAKKNKLIVLSDEVHSGLVFDRAHIPFFAVDDYARENSVTILGPAKTFNIAGLPFAFAIIPNKKLKAEFQKTCYAVPGPSVCSVIAARVAYGECRNWKNEIVEYLKSNRDYLEKKLRTSFPEAKFTHVEGTYLQWVDFRPLGIADPFKWLQEHPKIYAGEGKLYGLEGYVRLNFGTSRPWLENAMDRIEKCVIEQCVREKK